MCKKIFLAAFLGFLFFFFSPILAQPTANAANPCALGKLLNLSIKPNPPAPGNSIVVNFQTRFIPGTYDIEWGEKNDDGTLTFHDDNEITVSSSPGKTPDPNFEEYTIVHSKWKYGLVLGHTYYVEVSYYHKDNGRWCGKTNFTVKKFQSTGPPKIDFGVLTNDRKTLSNILITNLEGNTKYKIELEGLWEWEMKEDYRDRHAPGEVRRIFISDKAGKLKLTDICENGQAFREADPCGEVFKPGDYTVIIIRYSDGKEIGRKTWTVEKPKEDGNSGQPGSFELFDPGPAARAAVITILNFAIGMAGGVAFLLMIFGSYRLIFAGGNPESIQQGKEVITAAIIGLLIIVFSVLILRFLGIAILGIL